MSREILLLVLLAALFGCESSHRPAVIYPDDSGRTTEHQVVGDSTTVLTAELPIHFDSTDYLIFPIGPIRNDQTDGTKSFSSSRSGSSPFAIGYVSGNHLWGNFDNVGIQPVDSGNFRTITNRTLKIRSFTFLEGIRKTTKLQLAVMEITDRDTNHDGELTNEDLESLYLTHLDGTYFKKLTKSYQELLDWTVLNINNRLYFRTLEDIDQNGEFNTMDKLHYYYVELENLDFQVNEFHPI